MRKAVTAIGLSLAILLAIPLASESVVSHYRRWQAYKLLATVRGLRPGVTTESQARAVLKPFFRYEETSEQRRNGIVVREIFYQFYNVTDWTSSLAYHLRFLPFRFTLPWTRFAMNLEFVDGFLAEIHIGEMQQDQPGYIHPTAASVSILSTRFGALPRSPWGPVPAGFKGYSEYSQNTAGLDEKGNYTGFTCCYERFINLDERATPVQLSKSLNFQLHCLTSFLRCKDDHEILP
ncbi:MAG TPA: hypothetical protein VF865_18115 [Acidobacteriaceae bacterium]